MRSNHRMLLLALLLASCRAPVPEPGAGSPDPLPLAFGFSSYASISAARRVLPADSPWEVRERPNPRRGGCSRFDETNVTVAGFVTGDFRGELRLNFINDKLYRVLFSPDAPAAYFAWLRTHEGVFMHGMVNSPSRGVTALISFGPPMAQFASWTSDKLQDEVHRWIKRCS